MDGKLRKRIQDRKKDGSLRVLTQNQSEIDFFSNDYLGFAKEKFPDSSIQGGSSGSRLLSGNSNTAIECEHRLANFFDSESALIFNSGYDANLGFISAVAQRGDFILYDEYVHASIRDGIRLSNAKGYSFKHNDCDDLKRQLKDINGTVYIIVESLYSMDGDMAPLRRIQSLSKEFCAYLIVDEAHACGVYGLDGKGIVHAREMQNEVFCRIITFGKAYGFHGAAILCSEELKEYLINFSRPFIYSTALPLGSYVSIIQRVENTSIRERQIKLHKNIAEFRKGITNYTFLSEENSPIQVLEFYNKKSLMGLVDKMLKAGIYTKPIFPPTVPKGSYRARICIHSFNSEAEIALLKSCLVNLI